MYELKNSQLKVKINEKGAELASLEYCDKEYLWNANPEFWGRTAPVLFPFVGSVSGGRYRYNGEEFAMGQHGFARDMVFDMVSGSDEEAIFKLTDNEETFKKYPFHFELTISYKISETSLSVCWNVKNIDEKELHFSIGGHPAFMCPINGEGKQTDYSIRLQKNGENISVLTAGVLEGGLLSDKTVKFDIPDGILRITEHIFDDDALIIEDEQADSVSLISPMGTDYVQLSFKTPLLGIWSPAKKNAPFVCIEPWYGRCDRVGFSGDLSEREYGTSLKAGEEFKGGFTVNVK